MKIKRHASRACELNPEDSGTLHLLGRWCYSLASVTWIERKTASALFSTPPSSSYEEALQYFLKASEVRSLADLVPFRRRPPPFQLDDTFAKNHIFVGDCYVALKKLGQAKSWYKKALDVPLNPKYASDVATHQEAESKYNKYKNAS